ncbi:MAG: Flp pilus assembly protein CpaB [Blastocatellia bacterium]
MNKRFLMALGGAVFFGLLAIMVANAYLRKQMGDITRENYVKVWVSRTDIPAGAVIQESQIELTDFPKNLAQEVVKEKKDVVGKTAAFDILAKAPIYNRYLSSAAGSKIGFLVKDGYRAYAVPVNESSSVAGFITPGSYVDVISVLQPSGATRPVARTILQNVKVLAAGNQLQTSIDNASATPRAQNFSTVTLEVRLEEAQVLALASREGNLQLVIRNPNDRNEADVPAASLAGAVGPLPQEPRATAAASGQLASNARPTPTIPPLILPVAKQATPTPTPTATPTPARTVDVYRGRQLEKVQFPDTASSASKSN